MNNAIKKPKALLLAGFILLGCGAIAWQTTGKAKKSDTANSKHGYGDTTKPRKQLDDDDFPGMKELDEQMKELDEQMKDLDIELRGLDTEISKEIEKALAEIDFTGIQKELNESLNSINWKEIQEEIQSSMKEAQEELTKIDMEEIQQQVQSSLKEAQQKIKEIDMEKINKEMKELQEKLKSQEWKEKFNSDKIRSEINEAMEKAKESIKKAGEELKEMKAFTDELEKNGLIDKSKEYSIEWKSGGDLYINGKKQPKEVSDKYKKYYKGKDYEINMNRNDNKYKYNPGNGSI